MFFPFGHGVTLSASRHRLEKLIEDRAKPGSNKEAIERRIWELLGDQRAVMFTDLSGFSRNVAKFGIIHFLQTIYESIRIFVPLIEANGGILLKAEADSLLVIFRHPDQAMSCAIEMQQATKEYNKDTVPEERVLLCVGLGYGDMLLVGDEDVFGAEVNAASKLGEDTAKGGDVLVTENFRKNLKQTDGLEFDKIEFVPPGAVAAYNVRYRLA
jgi:class 3 adenylate cyclase